MLNMMKMQVMLEAKSRQEDTYHCSNPLCGKVFDNPKIIRVCPYCLKEIKEDQRAGCQHWFGYLGQREAGEGIPDECVECERSIECMLKEEAYSKEAVKEIKKWF
jgi:hypothetical protein